MLRRCVVLAALGAARAQHYGKESKEFHLPMPVKQCTKAGGCATQQSKVVLDSNWRWTHKVGETANCYTGNNWNASFCPDVKTCTQNCAIDGVDEKTWNGTYGVRTGPNGALNLTFVTKGPYSKNVGGRTYLMEDDQNYQIFKLLNKEFTFDIDTSALPCGLNGALYFVEMDKDGGKGRYPTNEAGAELGTGYCGAPPRMASARSRRWRSPTATCIRTRAHDTSADVRARACVACTTLRCAAPPLVICRCSCCWPFAPTRAPCRVMRVTHRRPVPARPQVDQRRGQRDRLERLDG